MKNEEIENIDNTPNGPDDHRDTVTTVNENVDYYNSNDRDLLI